MHNYSSCPVALAILIAVTSPTLSQSPPTEKIRKPQTSDTIKANVYADNTFMLYINGELIAVDSIAFVPHNVISVDILPSYPMTIAVIAKDNFDPESGMEYANTNIGDAGFILKFGDGTVTSGEWKAKKISWGPINSDTKNPRVESIPLPENWYATDFNDTDWPKAKVYKEAEVEPKQPFFENDFKGAQFIWSDDIALDNVVLFRHVVNAPPDGRTRLDFRNLNNIVPDSPARRKGTTPRDGQQRSGNSRETRNGKDRNAPNDIDGAKK